MRRLVGLMMVLAVVGIGSLPAARAEPGELDSAWGGDGSVTVAPGAARTFVQSAGGDRLFSWQLSSLGDVFGSPEVRRHRANGSLDESFGDGGVVRLDPPRPMFLLGVTNTAHAVIVVGKSHDALVVARLFPDGRVDRSWHLDGYSLTPFSNDAFVVNHDVHVAGDGSVQLFVRWLNPTTSGVGAHWYRFGALGRVIDDEAVEPDRRTVPLGVFAPNGDLVVLSFRNEKRLVRYRSPGVRHPGFADGGSRRIACGRGLDVDARGRILVVCQTDEENVYQLKRFDRVGAVDNGFSDDGSMTVRTGGPIANFDQQGFAFDRDGRIVLWSRTGADHRKLWMGQLTPRGDWDRHFGGVGRVVVRRPGKVQDDLVGFPMGTLTATRFVVRWVDGAATELVAVERV